VESSNEPDAIATALAAASRLCEDRRAMLIVDPLPAWRSVADVLSGPASIGTVAAGMRRANAAVYFPRVVSAGGAEQRVMELPPSGAIAGIIARTDGARGVWRAPAGQEATIDGIGGPAATISADEARSLAEVGVNSLRTFPGVGTIAWGARTLDGTAGSTSEWKYVNVRRLAILLERSIDRGLQWIVFEPNDDLLWAAIRRSVGAFMAALHRQCAFQGTTAREAYYVKCGRDTTTQEEIDKGIVHIEIGFAPLRPAEFVVIDIRLLAGDGKDDGRDDGQATGGRSGSTRRSIS
jgi:Bacteriophage tail sheath protein